MTAPRPATIERLYVSDDELPDIVGVEMTQKYDRGAAEATSNVMRLRSESRVNKK